MSGWNFYLAYLVPPSILFIPLEPVVVQSDCSTAPCADPGVSDLPGAVLHLALDRLFQIHPYELEECALVDGATRLQILRRITLPLAVPGLISAGIFSFTLSWNEFIYALAFIQSSANKTVPVAILTERFPGCVSVGSADGGLPARLAAGRDLLFAVRRLLRLVADRAVKE